MDGYTLNLNDLTEKIDNSLNIDSNKNVQSTTIVEINNDVDIGQINYSEQTTAIIVTEHLDSNDEGSIGQSAFNIGINNASCKKQMVISECTNVDYSEDSKKSYRMALVEEINDDVNNGLINYSVGNKMNIMQSSTPLKIGSRVSEKTNCSVSSNSSDNLEEEYTKPKHNKKKSNQHIAKHIKNNHSDLSDLEENNIGVTCLKFSKVGLKFNDVIEASLCKVVGPTRMTLIIKKIGGIDLTIYKEEMNEMLMKSASMPKLDKIVPGKQVIKIKYFSNKPIFLSLAFNSNIYEVVNAKSNIFLWIELLLIEIWFVFNIFMSWLNLSRIVCKFFLCIHSLVLS